MKVKITCFVFLVLNVVISNVFSQNIVNNGANIVIMDSAYVFVSDNFFNLSDGYSHGCVSLKGMVEVRKNWVNDADSGYVFDNSDSLYSGTVLLSGFSGQNIGGKNPTFFPSLKLVNSKKNILVNNCQVFGNLILQNASLYLNKNRLSIMNPNNNAIQYDNSFIFSETPPDSGYSEILWYVKDNIGNFSVPFGNGKTNYDSLNLSVNITSAGSDDGKIVFATYPVSPSTNAPYPTGVKTMSGYEPTFIADRFWIIRPIFSLKPYVDIIFSYTDEDILDKNNKDIIESNLKAQRYNPLLDEWNDIEIISNADVDNNKVMANYIKNEDFFDNWRIVNDYNPSVIYVPRAFSPNKDGKNEEFKVYSSSIDPNNFNIYIYDRWGKLIFKSNDINKGWDGRVLGGSEIVPMGSYSYYIIARDKYTKKQIQKYGSITVLR